MPAGRYDFGQVSREDWSAPDSTCREAAYQP